MRLTVASLAAVLTPLGMAGEVARQMANAPATAAGANRPAKFPMSDVFEVPDLNKLADYIAINASPTISKFSNGNESARLAYIRVPMKNKGLYVVGVYHNANQAGEAVRIATAGHGKGANKIEGVQFPGREEEFKTWTDKWLDLFIEYYTKQTAKPEATAYVAGSGRAVQGFLKKKAAATPPAE